MDVCHPNRAKMASVVCEILPFHKMEHLAFLDLGAGTGYLSHRIIETFPHATIIAVDAAERMVEKARLKLQYHHKRVTFQISSFQELPNKQFSLSHLDAVVSSFALHHLYPDEKLRLFKFIHAVLKPGGWFINCDIVKAAHTIHETRFRYLHSLEIQQRTKVINNRETSLDEISLKMEDKEKNDGDHFLLLSEDLQLLAEAGFSAGECFWKEYREAVYGGIK